MAFTENPRIFLADFGKDVTLTPKAGPAKPTRGLFDNGFSQGAGMGSSAPTLTVPSVDVPANVTGASTQVDGVSYLVDHPEADGTGWTVLVLEKA